MLYYIYVYSIASQCAPDQRFVIRREIFQCPMGTFSRDTYTEMKIAFSGIFCTLLFFSSDLIDNFWFISIWQFHRRMTEYCIVITLVVLLKIVSLPMIWNYIQSSRERCCTCSVQLCFCIILSFLWKIQWTMDTILYTTYNKNIPRGGKISI